MRMRPCSPSTSTLLARSSAAQVRCTRPVLPCANSISTVAVSSTASSVNRRTSSRPVTATAGGVGADGDGRAGPQRVPAHRDDVADLARVDQLGDLQANRRRQPVVHGVDHPLRPPGRRGDGGGVEGGDGQRLLAQHVHPGRQGPVDHRQVARRRRAEVDEVQRLGGQELVQGLVAAGAGEGRFEGAALLRHRLGRRHDAHVAPRAPARRMAVGRHVAIADEGASERRAGHARARTGRRSPPATRRGWPPPAGPPLR